MLEVQDGTERSGALPVEPLQEGGTGALEEIKQLFPRLTVEDLHKPEIREQLARRFAGRAWVVAGEVERALPLLERFEDTEGMRMAEKQAIAQGREGVRLRLLVLLRDQEGIAALFYKQLEPEGDLAIAEEAARASADSARIQQRLAQLAGVSRERVQGAEGPEAKQALLELAIRCAQELQDAQMLEALGRLCEQKNCLQQAAEAYKQSGTEESLRGLQRICLHYFDASDVLSARGVLDMLRHAQTHTDLRDELCREGYRRSGEAAWTDGQFVQAAAHLCQAQEWERLEELLIVVHRDLPFEQADTVAKNVNAPDKLDTTWEKIGNMLAGRGDHEQAVALYKRAATPAAQEKLRTYAKEKLDADDMKGAGLLYVAAGQESYPSANAAAAHLIASGDRAGAAAILQITDDPERRTALAEQCLQHGELADAAEHALAVHVAILNRNQSYEEASEYVKGVLRAIFNACTKWQNWQPLLALRIVQRVPGLLPKEVLQQRACRFAEDLNRDQSYLVFALRLCAEIEGNLDEVMSAFLEAVQNRGTALSLQVRGWSGPEEMHQWCMRNVVPTTVMSTAAAIRIAEIYLANEDYNCAMCWFAYCAPERKREVVATAVQNGEFLQADQLCEKYQIPNVEQDAWAAHGDALLAHMIKEADEPPEWSPVLIKGYIERILTAFTRAEDPQRLHALANWIMESPLLDAERRNNLAQKAFGCAITVIAQHHPESSEKMPSAAE